jgi:hypothetical protein
LLLWRLIRLLLKRLPELLRLLLGLTEGLELAQLLLLL